CGWCPALCRTDHSLEIAMRTHKFTEVCRTRAKVVLRVICWTAAGTLLGAAGGALFGAIYGTLDFLIHGELARIVWSGIYMALCGAGAGALVGAFGTIWDGAGEAPLPTDRSGKDLEAKNGHAGSSFFDKLQAITNPLIARWQFLERGAEGSPRVKDP